MKICCKCKHELDESMFTKSRSRKDGLHPQCRSCTKAWREENKDVLRIKKQAYYERNIEQMSEKNRLKYLKHRDKQRETQKTYYSQPENWLKRMLARARTRAEQEGMDFDVVAEDVELREECPYLKTKLTFDLGKGQLPTNASLDRIDSAKGYVKGNVQIISRKANTMKSNATAEELHTFALSILEGTTLEKYVAKFQQIR